MKKGTRKKKDLSGTIMPSPNLESGSTMVLDHPFISTFEDTDLWFSTFNAVEDAICIIDNQQRIVRSNSAMQKLSGKSEVTLIGKHCFEVVHGTEHPLAECPIIKMRQTLQRESTELKIGEQWFDVTVDPLFGPDKQLTGAVHIVRNITARKQTEERLKESEQLFKQRLDAILSPELDVGDLELADIINSKEIQAIMDDFYSITHIGVGLIDLKGKVLVANGWQDICTLFHRTHPETCQNCIESDTVLSLPEVGHNGKIKAYKCKNNMWDISTPIIVGGKHLGNIFLGQFLYEDEEPDMDVFREQARKYGFNEQDYIEALNRVPRWTHGKIEAVMNFYSRLSSLISNLSFTNVKLAKTIEERNTAVEELKSNYSLLRMAGKVAKFGGWSLSLDEQQVVWTDQVALIHEMPIGYSPSVSEGIKFYAPEWQSTISETLRQCAEEGIPFDKELELITSSGKRKWVRSIGEPVYDSSGRVYRIVGAFQDIHERKKLEKALRESEINARAIMESTDDALILVKRDGTVIDSNEGHARRLGVTRAELIGKNVYQFLPKEVAERRKLIVQQVLDSGEPYLGEDCRGEIWNEIAIHPVFEGKKMTDHVAIFGHNITARKQIEEALRKSEELLNLFMTYTPVFTFIKEVTPGTSTVIRASENFKDMIGIAGSQMEGKDMYELFPPDFAEKIVADDWETVAGGKILTLDEELNGRSYTTIKFPIPANGRNLLAGFTIDDTERKRVENEVKRMNSLLTATLESTADGILVVDRSGKISSFNNKFIELWRISEADIASRDDSSLIQSVLAQLKDPEGFKAKIRELNSFQEEDSTDIIEFVDGRVYERYSQAQRLEGEVIGRVWSFRDITERKQADQTLKENEIRLQELNATKDRLFSIVAHDLRNPFNSIVGFSSLLSAEVADKDYSNVERYARIIEDSSEKALDLLQNLLEWSRSQTGRLSFTPENLDICMQISQTKELLIGSALQKSISIYVHTPPALWVYADKAMVNIILRNLVSNAIKFTRPGGQIDISAKQITDDLVVSVADNGVGIPDEAISKLFRIDKGYSTFGTQNEKGTGLGLILCKELVERHNGQIWVESKKNEGSKFYFSIPISGK